MSASVLYIFLKRLNPNISIIPLFHSGKQHGISDKEIFNQLKKVEPSLLITPDSSSNDSDECKKLKNLGWDILVGGEHHQIECNNSYAIVVNNELGDTINRNGSGGLVTWHMCRYINRDLVKDLISYVAISLIGDSMDMTENENYTFTHYGRKQIHQNLQPFVDEFNKDSESNISYSFGMISRLNALIRLGNQEDKWTLFYALVGETDPSYIIERCKYYHSKQQRDSKSMAEKLESNIEPSGLIALETESSPLNGLVANKLMSKFNRPVMLLVESDGQYSGSTRSPYPIKDIINNFEYANGVGHQESCGIYIKSEEFDNFKEYINKYIASYEPCRTVLQSYTTNTIPSYLFSFKSTYNDLWGTNIPIPTFYIHSIDIDSHNIKEIGSNKLTIKFSCGDIDFIHFFTSNELKDKLCMSENENHKLELSCICELDWNEFRGKKSKQCVISEFIEIKDHTNDVLSFEDLF